MNSGGWAAKDKVDGGLQTKVAAGNLDEPDPHLVRDGRVPVPHGGPEQTPQPLELGPRLTTVTRACSLVRCEGSLDRGST